MSKVLVTGGAGFIGSHTVDALLERGYEVRILDSLEKPVHLKGKPTYIPDEAEFILGDVRSKGDVDKALHGVEFVFHLAAYQDYLTDFSKFFHVNSVGTALLYELIVEEKYPVQKIVVASSQAVYGEGKYGCKGKCGVQYPPPRPLEQLMRGDWEIKCPVCGNDLVALKTDESVVNPHNSYAISKYSQEMVAISLGKRYQIPTVCLRYSITQGPRQSFFNVYSGICRIFSLRMLHNQSPIVYEDGRQLRDYVYVGDAVRANLLVLERSDADYQVFNVGGSKATSVMEYARLVLDRFGETELGPVVPGEYRMGDTRHVVSDIGKLRTLGWQPETLLEEVIGRYIAWAREQPDVKTAYFTEADRVMKNLGAVRLAER